MYVFICIYIYIYIYIYIFVNSTWKTPTTKFLLFKFHLNTILFSRDENTFILEKLFLKNG